MIPLTFVLAVASSARAQTIPAPSPTPIPAATPSLEKEFFKNILRDQKGIWTAPFHLSKEESKWVVPSTVGTMALITTDRNTGDEIAESNHLKDPSRVVSYPGSFYAVSAVAASFYFVGRQKNDYRARETGILSAQATIDTLIVVSALKGITQRVRPQKGEDRSEFFDGGDSFPSGHAAYAWAVATEIANEYNDRPVVQIAAYSVATAVSMSRFTGGEHYLSDVLVGSALGYGIGRYVYQTHHRGKASTDDGQKLTSSLWPAIGPTYNRRARLYGVSLTWSF
jgi:hypothetical protein